MPRQVVLRDSEIMVGRSSTDAALEGILKVAPSHEPGEEHSQVNRLDEMDYEPSSR